MKAEDKKIPGGKHKDDDGDSKLDRKQSTVRRKKSENESQKQLSDIKNESGTSNQPQPTTGTIGRTTINRSRKKKAAPQPPGHPPRDSESKKETSSSGNKKTKKKIEEEGYLAFKIKVVMQNDSINYESEELTSYFCLQYFARHSKKNFKGTDTTKAAIENSKKVKGGKRRYLVLSEKDVKVIKRDAKVKIPS